MVSQAQIDRPTQTFTNYSLHLKLTMKIFLLASFESISCEIEKFSKVKNVKNKRNTNITTQRPDVPELTDREAKYIFIGSYQNYTVASKYVIASY